MAETTIPELSVIIAAYRAEDQIGDCLRSLAAQRSARTFEVIVVNSSADGTPAMIQRDFPGFRCLTFDARKYCGDARNAGIAAARAPVVAFIDADCVAAPDWVDAVLSAHRAPHLAVGGSIANAHPGPPVGWAAHILEFHDWMPHRPARWIDDMAAANLSFKREALQRFGPFIEGTYCSDSEFNWRLADAGHRIWFDPAIRVAHRGITDWRQFLSHEFMHGRSFGRVRARYRCFHLLQRLAYAVLWPLIAIKLFTGAARSAASDPSTRQAFVRSAGWLAVGFAAWALGEAAGYLSRTQPDQTGRSQVAT